MGIAVIFAVHFFYYPKWKMKGYSATISWDVSGYYFYLPSAFIYKDMRELKWKDPILDKYEPQPGFAQAFKHEASGNYVMKYSIGQAVIYSPFFFIAHAYATNTDSYPADGFSRPYQFMIAMGMLLWTIIGLVCTRWSLLQYFDEKITSLGILAMLLGTNYLNYVAIDGAMTHNTLFTLYAVLIALTMRFYKSPTWAKAIGIGFCVGLAALVRPTEIIACLIPILWGLTSLSKEAFSNRFSFLKQHTSKLLTAVLVTALVGFIQLGYWKYATGDWIVYSYQDQGFSWLKPHLLDGIFSYRTGWLIYSPMMIFSLLGFFYLRRQHKQFFPATFVFSMLFIYITFAWDIWWYGGSLGQRAMVQAYAVLIFPLAAFFQWAFSLKVKWAKVVIAMIAGLFLYANFWFTYQCHYGGIVKVNRMTKPYFWKTLFTYKKNIEDLKLLDNVEELYSRAPKNIRTVFHDSDYAKTLDADHKFTGKETIPISSFVEPFDWIRVGVDAYFEKMEWNLWQQTQFIVFVKDGDRTIKEQMFRIHAIMEKDKKQSIYLDLRKPKQNFTHIEVDFWNAESKKPVEISNLKVEVYSE